MEYLLWAVIALLFIIVVILTGRLYLIQRSLDEIRKTMELQLAGDTNILIDISSRDRYVRKLAIDLNDELRRLREDRRKYRRKDNELRDAITNISHDLRTPLTAICGYLNLLEDAAENEETQRYVAMIQNRTEVLKQLTEELFRYSVLASMKEEKREVLVLNRILEETLASYYGAFKEKGIHPEVEIAEKEIPCFLDASFFTRILGNIISNALKYSQGDLDITLNDEGEMTFSNSAPNLDSLTVARLFDRFYTVENGKNSTGLGLSIAKLLTERMGGTIYVEYSCEAQKLCIRLKFPQE